MVDAAMKQGRDERPRGMRERPALAIYTAATIIAGIAALVWAAVTFPVDGAISLTSTGGREGVLLGLAFWVTIGLLGGTRVERMQGHGVLTFHIPFIIAAMALGGPTAGALVAMLSTIERRELREVPWYGTLANHAALTLSAVIGGVALLALDAWLLGLMPDRPQAVELVAIVAAGAVMSAIVIAIVAGTVHLRDGLPLPELPRLYDAAFRATAATEVVLGWLLAFTYAELGWWAALITAILVLAVWQSHDARQIAQHDAMTGLLNRVGFDSRLYDAIASSQRRGRRAALLAIDLDGFKAINDTHGHAAGDDVIRAVGERLQQSIRLTDAAVRLGGDEFGVLLVDLPNAAAAQRLATRIHDAITAPIDIGDRTVSVGASIGIYHLERMAKPPSVARVLDLADREMFRAKASGGGLSTAKRAR